MKARIKLLKPHIMELDAIKKILDKVNLLLKECRKKVF